MLKQGHIVALDTTRNLLHGIPECMCELRMYPNRLPETLVARLGAARAAGRSAGRSTL